jgi:C_GCAxxG_C_C family probable redox protein
MEKNWVEIKRFAVEYTIDNLQNNGMNCSESVFSGILRSGALDGATPEMVAYVTGFGGGGGGTGLTCGALSSAILANCIAHGRKDPKSSTNGTELRDEYYRRYNNIVSDFTKVANGALCSEIINRFPEGYNDDATRPNCWRICEAAAGIAVDYLQKSAEEAAKLAYDPAVVRIKNWI